MTSVVFGGIAMLMAILQTTWFAGWTIAGARPDLALIVITVAAHSVGVQRGQVTGFAVGMVEDVLSLSPLGFHAVVRLAHGAVAGLSSGAVQADPILTPMLLVGLSTVVKQIVAFLFATILGVNELITGVFTATTAIELGLNVVLAPIGFLLLRPVVRRLSRRGGFS